MQAKTFYDTNGRIVGSVQGNLEIADLSQWDGFDSIEAFADTAEFYVNNGVLTERPINPATLNGTTISGIPCPGILRIDGSEYEVTDSVVELVMPSTTRSVVLDCFPYLPATFEVSA